MAFQNDMKTRQSRRIRLQRDGGSRPHGPARGGSAGTLPARNAGQQHRRVGLPGGQRQPPRGSEVEPLHLSPKFRQHGAHFRAARRFERGPQHPHRIAGTDKDQPGRIETELGQPGCVGTARGGMGAILPRPDRRTARGCLHHQAQAEADGRGRIRHLRRMNLMQRPPLQPGFQARQSRLERHRRVSAESPFEINEMPAQGGERLQWRRQAGLSLTTSSCFVLYARLGHPASQASRFMSLHRFRLCSSLPPSLAAGGPDERQHRLFHPVSGRH